MNSKIKFLISLVAVLWLSACTKDFLNIEPVDKQTGDNFFRNETEIRASTAALYGFPWFEFNDKFFWCAGDAMAGDMYYTYDQEGQFFYFSFTEGNSHVNAAWRGLFRVISYANSIINDMPRIAEGNNVSTDVINSALGEARFIRGTAYYILAEFWGNVPIVENSTELVSANNLFLPKNTQSSVYEFIRRDLVFASENLPSSDIPGRVTAYSAKGMLAKLHLTMASHLGDVNSAANFTKAKELAADVINNSGASLMSNYADLFEIENNNNSESLFSLQWIEGAYALGNSRQANWARSSLITGNSEAWGGGKCISYDFITDIEGGDKRQPSIYMDLHDHYSKIRKAEGGYTYNYVTRDAADPNIVVEGATPVLNSLKKYVVGSAEDTGGKVSTGQATAINQVLLRLADVYLVYVEASMGAGSSTADGTALEYFNAIRARADLPLKSSVTWNELLKERRVEFGLESIRWFDIKRYYYRDPVAALDYLNNQKRAHVYNRITTPNAPDENTIQGYELTPPSSPIVASASYMWIPIPASEVVGNALLGPNEPAVEYEFK
ncbi:MAG TPA: RagB/SusD family nutrient uptake outer membrane protein [Saprospiraceae bacterium]|nr:RagB/SusD family nutrient uptake outer membrane protein [Saprospiraceae bacterium]